MILAVFTSSSVNKFIFLCGKVYTLPLQQATVESWFLSHFPWMCFTQSNTAIIILCLISHTGTSNSCLNHYFWNLFFVSLEVLRKKDKLFPLLVIFICLSLMMINYFEMCQNFTTHWWYDRKLFFKKVPLYFPAGNCLWIHFVFTAINNILVLFFFQEKHKSLVSSVTLC